MEVASVVAVVGAAGAAVGTAVIGVVKVLRAKSSGNGQSSAPHTCPAHGKIHDELMSGKAEFTRINEKLDEQKDLSKEHGEELKKTAVHLASISTTLDLMCQERSWSGSRGQGLCSST